MDRRTWLGCLAAAPLAALGCKPKQEVDWGASLAKMSRHPYRRLSSDRSEEIRRMILKAVREAHRKSGLDKPITRKDYR